MKNPINEQELRAQIIDLEERLMDMIEVSSKYEELPVVAFKLESNLVLFLPNSFFFKQFYDNHFVK